MKASGLPSLLSFASPALTDGDFRPGYGGWGGGGVHWAARACEWCAYKCAAERAPATAHMDDATCRQGAFRLQEDIAARARRAAVTRAPWLLVTGELSRSHLVSSFQSAIIINDTRPVTRRGCRPRHSDERSSRIHALPVNFTIAYLEDSS